MLKVKNYAIIVMLLLSFTLINFGMQEPAGCPTTKKATKCWDHYGPGNKYINSTCDPSSDSLDFCQKAS